MLSVIYARLRYAADIAAEVAQAAAAAAAAGSIPGSRHHTEGGGVKQWRAPDKVGGG